MNYDVVAILLAAGLWPLLRRSGPQRPQRHPAGRQRVQDMTAPDRLWWLAGKVCVVCSSSRLLAEELEERKGVLEQLQGFTNPENFTPERWCLLIRYHCLYCGFEWMDWIERR